MGLVIIGIIAGVVVTFLTSRESVWDAPGGDLIDGFVVMFKLFGFCFLFAMVAGLISGAITQTTMQPFTEEIRLISTEKSPEGNFIVGYSEKPHKVIGFTVQIDRRYTVKCAIMENGLESEKVIVVDADMTEIHEIDGEPTMVIHSEKNKNGFFTFEGEPRIRSYELYLPEGYETKEYPYPSD